MSCEWQSLVDRVATNVWLTGIRVPTPTITIHFRENLQKVAFSVSFINSVDLIN